MIYTTTYQSPIGVITLAARDGSLIGAWFEGQKYFMAGIADESITDAACPVLIKTCAWLERYFNSERPIPSELPLAPSGTEFQHRVWEHLCRIPYSCTTSYGAIAKELAKEMVVAQMSAQAVGGAVSRNPISIIIPCHRVIGTNQALTGYAGGLDKKIWLLRLEGADNLSSLASAP